MSFAVQTKMDRRVIPALDGVRGLAAFIVVFYHLHLRHLRWWPDGSFGVLIFFVLSGFLITWLLLREADESGGVSLRAFYMRRSLRIFPAFYGCWTLYVVTCVLMRIAVPRGSTWSAFFYLGDYYFPFHENDTFLGFTWSLAVEEQFYLIWPFIFRAFMDRRATLAKWLLAAIACTWIWRAALKFVTHAPEHYLSYALDCHIDHLMIGALAALALRSGWIAPFWKTVCSPRFTAATIALLSLSVSAQIRFGHGYDHTLGFIVDPVLIAILLPQLISMESVAPFSWLNLPPARFFGRISYPLYLYHIFAIEQVNRFLNHYGLGVTVMASLSGAVLLAVGSYYLVERPFLKLKARYSAKNKAMLPLPCEQERIFAAVSGR
jgi:peptidoglycan/LPS O-acetylase OafA/YrhL